jgi:hypothetical protein
MHHRLWCSFALPCLSSGFCSKCKVNNAESFVAVAVVVAVDDVVDDDDDDDDDDTGPTATNEPKTKRHELSKSSTKKGQLLGTTKTTTYRLL